MTWGKLDDRLDDNEKFAGLSLSAAGLWLMCMPRALRNDDGFVPEAHALRFLSPTGRHSGRVLFRELVGAGLWEEVEGGWLIHDFTKYAAPNTNSAERVRRYRERKKAEKAQEAGQGNALQPLLKRDVTHLARARTRRVIPDPEPVNPVSVTNVPETVPLPLSRLVEVWNQNCGDLPRIRKAPTSPLTDLHKAMAHAVDYFGQDWDAMAASIQRCAGDDLYRTKRYGVEAWSRHLSRWDDPAGRPAMPNNHRAWAKTLDDWDHAPRFDKLGNPLPTHHELEQMKITGGNS